jgi:CheY-like chemotaxis protein
MTRQKTEPVLYAEDEADDVFFMQAAFKRAGVERLLHAVSDGEQAIGYLAGTGPYADRELYPLPGLVLLDLNLPGRSGFEVLAWLRSQPTFRDLTVVVFSSSGRPEDRAKAAKLGATEYLLKPASGGEFTNTARLLRERWLSEAGR